MGTGRDAVSGWAQQAKKNAGWIVALGVVTVIAGVLAMAIVLGILLLKEWPLSGLWAIGTLVGINLLFAGFSFISIVSAARGLAKRVA
jgi:uncharacterized membrane protein HdeD (DUF308 family)